MELKDCVKRGEVRCWKAGSCWVDAAVNVAITSRVAKKSTEKLNSKETELNEQPAAAFMEVFDAFDPEVNLPASSRGPSAKSIAGPEQSLALILFLRPGCFYL